jgi:nicotinamidase-related amidase
VEFQDRSEYKERMRSLLEIDPRTTVVLTVDMQRNYLDMEVAQSPVAPDEAERVLTASKELLDFARGEGIPVVHVYVARRPIEIERGVSAGPAKKLKDIQAGTEKIPDRMVGSPQAEVPASLVAPTDVHVTTKKGMDGFLDTDLESLLRRAYQADTVILTGINTDTCVYSTTFSASNRGFKSVVISDCAASMRGKENHWMALELLSRSFAWVLTVDQFKERVRAATLVPAR